MQLETLFKRGDTVFFMRDNKVSSRIVHAIAVNVTGGMGDTDRINVVYGFASNESLGQSFVFGSKEALLESL